MRARVTREGQSPSPRLRRAPPSCVLHGVSAPRLFALVALAVLGSAGGCALPTYELSTSAGPGGGATVSAGGSTGGTSSQGGEGGGGAATSSSGGTGGGGDGGMAGGGTGGMAGSGGSTPCDMPGCTQWTRLLGGPGDERAYAVAVQPGKNVLVGGDFTSPIDLGGGVILPFGGTFDGFAAHFDFGGTTGWARAATGTNQQTVRAVAVAGDGSAIVAGNFTGQLLIGDKQIFSQGKLDLYVARYDAAGNFQWAQTFGDTEDDLVYAMTVGPADNILLTGAYRKQPVFGAFKADLHGDFNVFVAKLSGADGSVTWLRSFGSASMDFGMGVAVDPKGEVTAVGSYQAQMAFEDGEALMNNSGDDAFVVHLDKDGNYLWRRPFMGPGGQFARAVGTGKDGTIYVAGDFDTEMNLDTGVFFIRTEGCLCRAARQIRRRSRVEHHHPRRQRRGAGALRRP